MVVGRPFLFTLIWVSTSTAKTLGECAVEMKLSKVNFLFFFCETIVKQV